MEVDPNTVRLALNFGSGQEAEMECAAANALWMAVGPGMESVDVWMKEVAQLADLRVRVSRLADGIEIVVDRGSQEPNRWGSEKSARLRIQFDRRLRKARINANLGQSPFNEVGTVDF